MLLHNLIVNGQFVLVDEFWCDASYAYKNEGYWPDATSRYLNILPRETKKKTKWPHVVDSATTQKKHGFTFFGIYESPKDTNSIFLQAKNTQTCTNSKC